MIQLLHKFKDLIIPCDRQGGDRMNRKFMWMLKSLLVSYVVTVILLLLLTLLLYKFELGERIVSAGIVAIYVLSTLTGGLIIGKTARTRRFIWGISLGMIYFLLLLLITLGVYREISADTGNLITTLILCVGGGMIGGMIS